MQSDRRSLSRRAGSPGDRTALTRQLHRRAGGAPVYTYVRAPGSPPLGVGRLGSETELGQLSGPHAHDFLVLAYFETGGGSLDVARSSWEVEDGDLYIIGPGETVRRERPERPGGGAGWAVFFPLETFADQASGSFLAWASHPLLFPLVRGTAGAGVRLRVPPRDRPAWSDRLRALERELQERQESYVEAAQAHLLILLVEVARLTTSVVDDARIAADPLLTTVFGIIEERYADRLSLVDVAGAVGLSPPHLTTVVRKRTGRTVLEWIHERRMAEARRLLVQTDLTVEEIAERVGFGEPGYFARAFRRTHGTTPTRWRNAGRL